MYLICLGKQKTRSYLYALVQLHLLQVECAVIKRRAVNAAVLGVGHIAILELVRRPKLSPYPLHRHFYLEISCIEDNTSMTQSNIIIVAKFKFKKKYRTCFDLCLSTLMH